MFPHCIIVMGWRGRRTGHRQRSLSKMETTARGGGNRVLLYSSRQFSAHPKILTRTHRQESGADRKEHALSLQSNRHSEPQNGWQSCLARTNTFSSTITKLIKTWKTSNESYNYNLLNRANKMYTHDLFNLQQGWEAWLAPVYNQIETTKSQLTQCTKY